MPEVFAQNDTDFRRTSKVKHQIKLSDETTFKLRAGPTHSHYVEAIRDHVGELINTEVTPECESPFSSQSLQSGRRIASSVQEIKPAENKRFMDSQRWATSLSRSMVASGSEFSIYYQIEVDEANETRLPSYAPLGFSDFNWKPQGVTNSPTTFRSEMEKCMRE